MARLRRRPIAEATICGALVKQFLGSISEVGAEEIG